MSSELIWMSACELLDAYRAGRISPVEATRAVLDRIEAKDEALNAFCLVDAERALGRAQELATGPDPQLARAMQQLLQKRQEMP